MTMMTTMIITVIIVIVMTMIMPVLLIMISLINVSPVKLLQARPWPFSQPVGGWRGPPGAENKKSSF